MKRIYLALISLLSLSFLSAAMLPVSPVSALESGDIVVSIRPSSLDVDLNPGETFSGSVTVSNVGRLPFDIKATTSPFQVNSDYEPDFVNESSYTRLYNWIKLEKDKYHIEPGGNVKVNFTIDVPEGVAGGGQYAAILLSSDSGVEEQGAMKVNTQLAAIIYGHINGEEMHTEGKLLDYSLPGFMFNRDFSVSQTVQNTGNVDFKVTQKMKVTNFFTNEVIVDENTLAEDGRPMGYSTLAVLPGTTRTGVLTWQGAPHLGLFRVTQEISFLDQDYSESRIVLICPIWLTILVLTLIVVLIVWIILKVKKKHDNKAEVA